MKIRPLTLQIEKSLWHNFKSKVKRDKTLNQAVVDLIKKEVKQKDG